jgi:hypothetical protein
MLEKFNTWPINYKILTVIAIFFLLSNAIMSMGKNATHNSQEIASDNKLLQEQEVKPENKQEEERPLKHEIVYVESKVRHDSGKSFYVLIDPVDISSKDFKESIKSLVRSVANRENNKKVSVLIFDQKSALELYYKQYVELSLGRVRTEAESEDASIHIVATYDGDLETMLYRNSLSFFPSASSKHPVVGRHVETIEFDARQ